MDTKSELFDLKREKQELDQFLSTIAGAAMPESDEAKPEGVIRPAEFEKPFVPVDEELPKPKPLVSPIKFEETLRQTIRPDGLPEADDQTFMARKEEVLPLQPKADVSSKPKVTSSFLPGDEEEQPLPKVIGIDHAKAPENTEVMARFGESSISEENKPLEAGTVPKAKVFPEAELEKKAEQMKPYDFAPEKKKIGKGKLIGVLLVVLAALLFAVFWLFGDVIKTSLPAAGRVIETVRGFLPSSASDVNLINVRQRFVYNVKLGKSIRVVEGLAENASTSTISNIKVSAVLYGAGGEKLATMESFGGNILIDPKLETLEAGAIQSALQTGKAAGDPIPPKGQIPFMIVFIHEPAGIFKMSVVTVDLVKH